MIAQWMIYTVTTSLLLAFAARAGEEVLRLYRLPLRWVWVATLCGSALLPLIAWASGGAWPRGLLDVALSSLEWWSGGSMDASAEPAHTIGSLQKGELLLMLDGFLLGLWFAGSILGLVSYGWTWHRLALQRRKWRASEVAGASVMVSQDAGPVVVGMGNPAIVVPEWLLGEPAAAQQLAMLHEAEHIRARDHVLLALAPLLAIAVPLNPVLWWQLRRLRLAVELDCDARVLRRGVEAGDYGSMLLGVASRFSTPFIAAAALAEPRSFLERRIFAMTNTVPRWRFVRAPAFTAVAILGAVLACETATPTNLTKPNSEQLRVHDRASDAEGTTVSLQVELRTEEWEAIGGVANKPLMLIDGRPASEHELKQIPVGSIKSVEVLKGPAALSVYGETGRNGVVYIGTQ